MGMSYNKNEGTDYLSNLSLELTRRFGNLTKSEWEKYRYRKLQECKQKNLRQSMFTIFINSVFYLVRCTFTQENKPFFFCTSQAND